MRVLHYLGNQGMTGVETFVLTLATAQRASGIDACITCHPKGREELLHHAQSRGVPMFPFVTDPRPLPGGLRRKARRAALSSTRVASLAWTLARRAFDVIHLHPVGVRGLPAFMGALIARTPKVVVTHHATLTWFAPFRSRTSDWTFWLEGKVADRVVMPYRRAADEMVEAHMPEAKVQVIPFCVDLERFAVRERRPNLDGPLRVLMTARLVEGKGHTELLEALRTLKARGVAVHAVVAGDGPLKGEIAARVRAHGLEEQVSLLGPVGYDLVPDLLAQADAMVLPTYMPGETFPICLLEAAAMGLPAVATRWFGIPDIVQDGRTGLLVEPRDAEALAGALEQLARDRILTFDLGQQALARARSRFATEVVAASYAAVYRA
jgi:glycosyltransferase involved in cell wall biosynthesis